MHFLDVGAREYGDAVLCQLGGKSVLIDGAHPGDQVGAAGHPAIPEQLQSLLGAPALPLPIDLLVVTHAHQDHIGCLPHLVRHGLLTVKWALVADPQLGWGRPHDNVDADAPADPRVRNVVSALREEVPTDLADERAVAQVMIDAATLEQAYRDMLAALEASGTRIVRHGRDRPTALLRAFADIGLKILGPSEPQLLLCAQAIADRTQDAATTVTDMLTAVDAPASDTALFRALLQSQLDAADAGSRPGPAINLQSIVTRFELGEVKLLFAGDMQFADPQIGGEALGREVMALRRRIAAEAPFSLVKLSHHGSDNAFDSELLAELGATSLYGICAGEDSASHPNPSVLRLLDAERNRLRWVRTDHNGLSTITFANPITLSPAQGQINDARPNTPDTGRAAPGPVPARRPAPAVAETAAARATAGTAPSHDPVEVLTRIPAGVRRVVVAIDVDSDPGPAAVPDRRPRGTLTLAGGRDLPQLLFVTSREALARNVGEAETGVVLAAIRDAGLPLLEDLPGGVQGPQAVARVHERLRGLGAARGVVLLGGYDVVPAQRRDCLPPPLRAALGPTQDPDNFIVWSDDGYGERPGTSLGALAVSRVPDGRSADTLMAALGADDRSRGATRRGVRNVERPFAEEIFAALRGDDALLISQPTTYAATPALDADLVYLMLHGDYVDSSRFWGENTAGDAEAVNLTNIPEQAARVIFTGCCWGALTVEQPAQRSLPAVAPAPKTSSASIALRFLESGATAFVGCTGAHYSPVELPYGYFGGPIHEAFWRALAGGHPPAEALLAAKGDYVRAFPHGRRSEAQHAIEYKTLNQYTCLGLGW